MAGLILNLASLKAKADAAGVANTANNTTPNLCPLKSAIAGYVTNGATVVNISGTWANNLLVEDACVAVNKTITGTTTVYRNVSAGNQQGGGDIPAGGGSSLVYKVVTYEYATKTTFSDGTSTTGAYTSGSYTVHGSTVSANSLGTTVKARTYIGTSSATETVAGTSVSVSGYIYLEANAVISLSYTYKDVSVGSSSASDIPASGGSRRALATVSYKEAPFYTYTSGSTSTGTWTNYSQAIYGSYVSAESLGTTVKARTAIGTSTPSGTVAGATRTGSLVTVYLAANDVSTSTVYKDLSVGNQQYAGDIPAGGGSSYYYKYVTYKYATKYTYTSGSETTGTYYNGSGYVYGSSVSATSLGTTEKARTSIGTSSASTTYAGTSVSVSGTVYQAANVKTTETLYRNVEVDDSDASYIPAGGGSSRAYAYVSYEYATQTNYTSGSSSTSSYTSTGLYIYGSYVYGDDLGSTIKKVTSKGTSTPSGWVAGATRTSNLINIYQAANYITAILATTSEGTDYHVRYNNIGAAGGSSSPQGSGRCKYTFKSGYTETNGSTTPFDNVTASYSRTYSEYSDSSGAFSVNSNGVVSVGSNSGSSRSVTVRSTLTVSISYASAYSSLSKPSSSSITHYPTCTQSGNSVTVDYYELRMRTNSVDMIPSAGGTSGAISIDWVKFTTYYKNSDGTSAGNDGGVIVTSSINSTKYYGLASGYPGGTSTTYWSNQPSSWSTSSSSAKKTISAINTSTSDISSFNGTTYYAAMKVSYTYGGTTYYAWDSSIIKQAGKKSLGNHLTISVNNISNIPYSGGYSSAITLASAWFSTEYDNGLSSGFDATSSVSKYYGKKTGSTAPTDSEMKAVTSTDSSSSVMYAGRMLGPGGIIGYAIMKCFCNGQFAWAYAQVNQSAYTAPTTGFYMYITPARYNSNYMTSPALNLILSNGTTVSGHSRYSSITTQYKTWNSSGTVSKFSLAENNIQNSGSRANYISIYTVVNGITTYYANKLYIGGSSAGTYNLSKTFHTSDFNNGSKYLYITYYFS